MCVKLEIQIYRFLNVPPPPPSNKSKGKSTTAVYTILHLQTLNSQCGIRSSPQTKTTTFCLGFCINPSSMRCCHPSSPCPVLSPIIALPGAVAHHHSLDPTWSLCFQYILNTKQIYLHYCNKK